MTLLEFLRTAEPDAIALEILRLQMTAVKGYEMIGDGGLGLVASFLASTLKCLQEEHEPGLDSGTFQLALLTAKKLIQKKEEQGL